MACTDSLLNRGGSRIEIAESAILLLDRSIQVRRGAEIRTVKLWLRTPDGKMLTDKSWLCILALECGLGNTCSGLCAEDPISASIENLDCMGSWW